MSVDVTQLRTELTELLRTFSKGENVVVFDQQIVAMDLSNVRIDVSRWNAVAFHLYGPAPAGQTAPTVDLIVYESDSKNGRYLAVPDTTGNSNETPGLWSGLADGTAFVANVGKPWAGVGIKNFQHFTAGMAGWRLVATAFSPSNHATTTNNITASSNISQIGGAPLSLGQKPMADSIPMVLASDQGALTVRGNDAAGAVPTASPVLVAGSDGTDVRTLKTDANGNLETSLATGLDNQDDAVAANAGALYPTQGVATISASVASVTVALGSLSLAGPSLFDAKHAALWIENTSGQTISGLQLEFSDTIGSTATTLVYPIPNVSIPTGSVGNVLVPITAGKLKTVSLLATFAANASTGAVKVQAVFSAQALRDLPLDYRIPGNVTGLSTTTPTQVIGAPIAGLRLYLVGLTVTNSASTGTLVSLTDGSGGTILDLGYAAQGGGWTKDFGERGYPLTAETALYVVCGTASASVNVAAQARLGV